MLADPLNGSIRKAFGNHFFFSSRGNLIDLYVRWPRIYIYIYRYMMMLKSSIGSLVQSGVLDDLVGLAR